MNYVSKYFCIHDLSTYVCFYLEQKLILGTTGLISYKYTNRNSIHLKRAEIKIVIYMFDTSFDKIKGSNMF